MGVFIFYIFVYMFLLDLVNLPISFETGFIHEHRYNFSNQSKKEWFIDHLKEFFISFIMSVILLGALLFLFHQFPEYWWLMAGGFMAFFAVIMGTLFPVLIMPLFHKYESIEDEDLKEGLTEMLNNADLEIEGFYREDTSRKTTKENAMFAGLGKTKRVILADNIINNMTLMEIKSVLAHEVGHYKKSHMVKNIIIGTIVQIFAFFLLHVIMSRLFPQFLQSFRANLSLLPMFMLFLGIIDLVFIRAFQNWISRKFEKQADRLALELSGEYSAFKSAIAGLANRNLSNAYPEPWVKIFYYDHPPVGERLQLAEESEKNQN